MKASKAHKRLAKIEAIISDLTERYSKDAIHIRKAFQDSKAAVDHVKAAGSSQASSRTAKKPPVKRKKAAVKRAAAKPAIAKTTMKSAPVKKAVKKTVRRRRPRFPCAKPLYGRFSLLYRQHPFPSMRRRNLPLWNPRASSISPTLIPGEDGRITNGNSNGSKNQRRSTPRQTVKWGAALPPDVRHV